MSGPNTADQVPGLFDVLVDHYGYVTARAVDPNMPFRVQQSQFNYLPMFVERTNVSGNYGDDAQAFFLTASQNDWSLGEGRRFFRSTDADGVRRYWSGTNVDPVSTPGQVTIRRTTPSLAFAAAVSACTDSTAGIYTTSSTKLYLVDATGTITDKGVHGLGAAPSQWGVVGDSVNVFLTTTAAGTVGVRRYDGASFTTWSTTASDSLAFLDNTVFGYSEATGVLYQYSSSGVASAVFPWKDGNGGALTGSAYGVRLRAYGGKLLILRRGKGGLWQYDGTGVSTLAAFPPNFSAQEMDVVSGIAVVSGYVSRNGAIFPAIYYYVGGQVGLAWIANASGYTNTTWPAVAAHGEGFAFTDDTTGHLMAYNVAASGVHTLGTYTVTNATAMLAANKDFLLHTRNATTGYYYPSPTVASSATVKQSLVDFDSSRPKYMRGIQVEFDPGVDGDGGSVDIAYQYDTLSGSFTTLQTAAMSGHEYSLTGVQAHRVAPQITLNRGTSTYGPALKRVYVRAAPVLTAYRVNEFILDLGGDPSANQNPVVLRDGLTPHPLNGEQQRANLSAAIASQTPISITDRSGTYTAVLEPANCEFDLTRPGQWYARIQAREV